MWVADLAGWPTDFGCGVRGLSGVVPNVQSLCSGVIIRCGVNQLDQAMRA
jgi:hypothetical protein